MRRYLRKPREWTTREFHARLQELNAYLEEFPPFAGATQRLSDDDLVEVLEFAVPASWQKDMIYQGFNASKKTATDVVEFCERLEFTETLSESVKGKNSQGDSKSTKKNNSQGNGKTSEGANSKTKDSCKRKRDEKYCPLHDTNGHDISECKVLLNQAKKMQESWKTALLTQKGASKRRKNSILWWRAQSNMPCRSLRMVRSAKSRQQLKNWMFSM